REARRNRGDLTRREEFSQDQVLVAARVVLQNGHDFEAMPGVEGRSLEAEGGEEDLAAAAAESFLFCRPQQFRPQPLSAPRLLHPDLTDFEGAALCVPADTADDSAAVISREYREPLTIGDAGRGRIEVVESILQVLDLVRRRRRVDGELQVVSHLPASALRPD